MPTALLIAPLSAGLLAIALAGCAVQQSPQQAAQPANSSTQGTTLVQTGEVTNVRDLTVSGGQTSGAGPFVGGVLGAIVYDIFIRDVLRDRGEPEAAGVEAEGRTVKEETETT